MKRIWIAIIILFAMLLVGCVADNSATSVTNKREIQSVSIVNKYYSPVYMYSFSNAEVLNSEVKKQLSESEYENIIKYASTVGYFLSSKKYDINQKIKIDFTNFFDGTELRNVDGIYESVEIEILTCEIYPITIEEKTDTFVVEYYTFNAHYDISGSSDNYKYRMYPNISEDKTVFDSLISNNVVETVKENVVIYYDK